MMDSSLAPVFKIISDKNINVSWSIKAVTVVSNRTTSMGNLIEGDVRIEKHDNTPEGRGRALELAISKLTL